jgi:hypothetical protein
MTLAEAATFAMAAHKFHEEYSFEYAPPEIIWLLRMGYNLSQRTCYPKYSFRWYCEPRFVEPLTLLLRGAFV